MIYLTTQEARNLLGSLIDHLERPQQIDRATWAALKRAELDHLSWGQFGALVDIHPGIMGELTDIHGEDIIVVPGDRYPREAALLARDHVRRRPCA